MKTAIRNFSAFATAILIVMASSTVVIANNDKNKEVLPVEFKFIGKMEQQPVYQLNINNTDGEEYSISFSDQSGTVLYSGNTKKGSQRFMIKAEEVGDEVLTVSITSRKTNKSYVYTIRRNQSMVEENIVKRIR